jgi:hypothetical protein
MFYSLSTHLLLSSGRTLGKLGANFVVLARIFDS